MARYSRHVMQVERVQVALVIFGYLAFYFLSSGFVIIAVVSSPPLIFIYLFIIELDADIYIQPNRLFLFAAGALF